MKRYLLFSGAGFYPRGGWDDFKGSFDSIEDALAHKNTIEFEQRSWWHVVDTQTGEIIHSGAY